MNASFAILMPMDEREWRESIRGAAQHAAEIPSINMSGLAQEVGWKPQSLTKFRDSGSGNMETIRKLHEKLIERGVLVEDTPEVHDVQSERFRGVTETP